MRDAKRAREIIKKIKYTTISSVTSEGDPWNSPVFSAYDQDYNFYWGTNKDSQKAQNIRANGKVFLVIYDSTLPSGMGEGVYIKATAEELTVPDEIKQAYKLLKSRHDPPFWELEAIEKGPIRIYRATPEKIWMNDDSQKDGFYIDTRIEITL